MKTLSLILVLVANCAFAAQDFDSFFGKVAAKGAPAAAQPPRIEVFFSPGGGCSEAIISVLDRARKSVLVQAYSFTSAPIAKALVAVARRGLDVRIILDAGQLREGFYSASTFTTNAGIPTWIDAVHAAAHDKVMIIDGETVITGSFNFTKAAEEKNGENLLIIRSPDIARKYTDNWNAHQSHSEPQNKR
jgi:phosphatidylserine/phosphatidylglycerophosphate/cardiolipin synthase-like enzyme